MLHLDLLVEAILLGLAGWRVANLLVNEDGPALIFERLRVMGGVKPGLVSGFTPTLFTCIFCMSVWTTTAMAVVWYFTPEPVMIIAAWAIALIVNKLVNPD